MMFDFNKSVKYLSDLDIKIKPFHFCGSSVIPFGVFLSFYLGFSAIIMGELIHYFIAH